ncbi:MAG: aldolase [Bacillota bacterium]
MEDLIIPLSVPANRRSTYKRNYKLATANTGKLLLFAGDQKIEHLNDDFYGKSIDPEDASPEHLFLIAANIPGAVLATHIGLLDRYGQDYRDLPYIVKLNGKSPINRDEDDIFSGSLVSKDDLLRFIDNSKLKIVGLGYTVYLGSKREAKMLKQAAKAIQTAHEEGLLAIIWMYPRHSSIKNEEDLHLIAGGAGVAASLGADFVKVKYPYKKLDPTKKAEAFEETIKAAGRTGVICVGGSRLPADRLLRHLSRQLEAGSKGLAIGRNLHQRSLEEAAALGRALTAMIHKGAKTTEAIRIMKSKVQIKKRNKSKILGLF